MSVQQGTAHRPWVDRLLSINGWLVFGFLYLPILILVITLGPIFTFSPGTFR